MKKQIEIISPTKNAQESILQSHVFGSEAVHLPLFVQKQQINDQFEKCIIINPMNCNVITQYAKQNEMVAMGKAHYMITDIIKLLDRKINEVFKEVFFVKNTKILI